MGDSLIYPNSPTRVTLFDAAGLPTARWTLQPPDREGRILKFQPQSTLTTGGLPNRERSLCVQGFRRLLEIHWAVDTGSLRELRQADGTWAAGERFPTALALASIYRAESLHAVRVEPWAGSEWGTFDAETYANPFKLRDRKGICHVALELKLEAIQLVQSILPIPAAGGAFVAAGFVEPGFVE